MGQSYQNLEILLVDDASTDGSGERCNWWALRDSRIRLIHLQKGGAGAARNEALDRAQGQLIGFVDADDWIASDHIESLVKLIVDKDADLAIGASSYVYEDGSVVSKYIQVGVVPVEKEEAFKYVNLPGYFGVAPWDKLARAELFDAIRFPDIAGGGEDYVVAYALLDRARKIMYDSFPRYYYRQRARSLSNRSGNVAINHTDATQAMVELVRRKYPSALPYAAYGHVAASLGAYNSVLRSGETRRYASYLEQVRTLMRRERQSFQDVVPLSRARRIQLWLVGYCPSVYRVAYFIYKSAFPRRAE